MKLTCVHTHTCAQSHSTPWEASSTLGHSLGRPTEAAQAVGRGQHGLQQHRLAVSMWRCRAGSRAGRYLTSFYVPSLWASPEVRVTASCCRTPLLQEQLWVWGKVGRVKEPHTWTLRWHLCVWQYRFILKHGSSRKKNFLRVAHEKQMLK